ncbi:hypothetical protein IV454_20625 [Massilia antarctica]|uniref:Uncharacterized protein n=1 Tax=Massilia antarctica TaxID=2765360 RepID=A0AA48W8F7_9BURK|nr:hypothetical protein [Massilia antarctica]QPI47963.1 hypothetical protein IV454_20625 [Massilia antarctica]
MSIPAPTSYPSPLSDQRLNTRRADDIEQRAYAAVGRSFATGSAAKSRQLRVVLAAVAAVTVLILIALVALLAHDNVSSPRALAVAAASKAMPHPAGPAHAARARPVVIIDEKDEAPTRPVVAAEPIPPLVLLAPAAAQPAPMPVQVQARPLAAMRTPIKVRAHGKAAGAALKHAASKAKKPARPLAARSAQARKAARKAPAHAPAKRKMAHAPAASPAHADAPVQNTRAGVFDTLRSDTSLRRRYLDQPLPIMAARLTLPARRYLGEP